MKTKLVPFNIEKAQAGAKIVTRCGRRVRIGFFDLKDEEHPIVGAVETDGGEVVCSFTKDGRRAVEDEESRNDAFKNVFDLFIEEEVEEEPNNFEIMPDKWYLCTREVGLWLKNEMNWISFKEGVPYPGADILKCDLSFEPEFYQKYFKPWNICYAKPGDVLASKNGTNILIFKQIETITSFSSYYNIQHRRDDCWANDCFIPATKEQYSQIFKKMKEDGYEWGSERNELKEIATDKVEEEVEEEPNNFEIMPDKWYLCTRGACLWLEDGINYTSFMEGVSYLGADILKCNLSFEHEFYQNYFRYWDIKDAEDGDVLHSIGLHNDCIFIFNGLDNWKFDEPDGDRAVATGYCCLFVAADKIEFGIQGPDCIEVNTTAPATQAQRDLLFQKMKEAGYKWDEEKKELKKIEEVKKRRMTNQELAWWLRDHPEEHREWCSVLAEHAYSDYDYHSLVADFEVSKNIRIRKNGGEWEEPLIEE